MNQTGILSRNLANEFGFSFSNEDAPNLVGEIRPNNIVEKDELSELDPIETFAYLINQDGGVSETLILLGIFSRITRVNGRGIKFNVSYVEDGSLQNIKNVSIRRISLERYEFERLGRVITVQPTSLISFELSNLCLSEPVRRFLKGNYHLFLTVENMTDFVDKIISRELDIGSILIFKLKNRKIQRGVFLGFSSHGEIMVNIKSEGGGSSGLYGAFGGVYEFSMEKVRRIEIE
jgi:hypothetical protein